MYTHAFSFFEQNLVLANSEQHSAQVCHRYIIQNWTQVYSIWTPYKKTQSFSWKLANSTIGVAIDRFPQHVRTILTSRVPLFLKHASNAHLYLLYLQKKRSFASVHRSFTEKRSGLRDDIPGRFLRQSRAGRLRTCLRVQRISFDPGQAAAEEERLHRDICSFSTPYLGSHCRLLSFDDVRYLRTGEAERAGRRQRREDNVLSRIRDCFTGYILITTLMLLRS